MTYEEMLAMLESLGDDVSFYVHGTVIDVTVEDFEGFDDDWCEIERDFDDEDAVEAFLEMLDERAFSVEGDFYHDYHFDGFTVHLGYASFDI